jgi:hypothetical protein
LVASVNPLPLMPTLSVPGVATDVGEIEVTVGKGNPLCA